MLSCTPTCRPAWRGASVIEDLAPPAARGSSALKRTAIAIPIILVVAVIAAGVTGLLGVVAAYSYYERGLPNPEAALADLEFDQQTVVYDRTGTIELARLGERKREIVTFSSSRRRSSTPRPRSRTRTSGQPRLRPGRLRLGHGRHDQRPAPRRLDDHPAARRARLLPPSAFEGSREERKIREIIQSLRLTQAYPGEKGKQQIITAYLNQNFYGNQSYGVKAAAEQYFGKPLPDLTLAEAAILAAIPQSPTKFDLVKNAEQVCLRTSRTEPAQVPARRPAGQRGRRPAQLHPRPDEDPEPPQRQGPHADEYEAAKAAPVVLAPQAGVPWKAPHFVWQVRNELAHILCPGQAVDACEKIDTGGYRVTSTLNLSMQGTTEKWVYVTARAPNISGTDTILKNLEIPSSDHGWIKNLRGKEEHPQRCRRGDRLPDRRSPRLCRVGQLQQPRQREVPAPVRRAVGRLAPTGILDQADQLRDRHRGPDDDSGDDVHGRRDGLRQELHADPGRQPRTRTGPRPLGAQFSLNIPSIKAGIINGLDHFYERSQDFGIQYIPGSAPVISMGIGTIELHPIDLLGAYGAIANGGVLMPRTTILSMTDSDGNPVYPDPAIPMPKPRDVISPQAAYIITDILAGNTNPKVNPFWAEWAVYDGKRPPARRVQDRHDERQPRHARLRLPGAAGGSVAARPGGRRLDGQQQQRPEHRHAVARLVGAPLVADHARGQQGSPIEGWHAPSGLEEAKVDAFTGMRPGRSPRRP